MNRKIGSLCLCLVALFMFQPSSLVTARADGLLGLPFLFSNPLSGYGAHKGRITHVGEGPPPVTCGELAKARPNAALWQGLFIGSREGLNDNEIRVGGRFCFLSERACRAWLFDMNSVNKEAIRANSCKLL